MWNAIHNFVSIRQQPNQSVQDYFEKFTALKEVNSTLGVNLYDNLGMVEVVARENGDDLNALSDAEKNDYLAMGEARMAAIHMLMGADKGRFGGAVEDFAHSYLMDRSNQYPADTQACYNLLRNWQKPSARPRERDRAGVSFNTLGDDDGTALFNDGGGKRYIGPPCEKCGWNNHATADCRAKKHKDGTMLHVMLGNLGGVDVY